MFQKLYAIAKNTFSETIRQPIYAIIIITALIMLFISPSITMYTMDDDDKMLREIGLSTIFLSGLFIAVFAASSSITDEIDTKTVLTVLSKPVSRFVFIVGKFIGIASAIALSHILLTIFYMMMVRHGVLETASDTHDWTVISFAGISILLTIIISAFLNYFYDYKFTSTAIVLLSFFTAIAVAILAFIDPQWAFNPANNNFQIFDIYGSLLLLQAVIILVILAIAFSTRFNIIITLCSCIAMFFMGLINDYLFGKAAITAIWAKAARAIVPNFQIFWITDAIYEETAIPFSYIISASGYSLLYISAILLIATALFQRRQVG